MAQLILTEEEKHTLTFLEWSDESLGKAVKQIAMICNEDHGKGALRSTGAAVFLISEAIRNGATELEVKLEGAYNGKENLGNWIVKIQKQDE